VSRGSPLDHEIFLDTLSLSQYSMLCSYLRRARVLRSGNILKGCLRTYSTEKTHNPLRVLFCGSDDFSIHSLRAIRDLQARRDDKIHSIEVVCRPDKRTGRNLKNLHQVPIKAVAQELDLPLHQINTFTGWTPPNPYDIVIAVSFGLLVPPRILSGAQYGGLNVHGSLLPELKGPAPIQHALLQRKETTGVTLQTLHPKKFDHGLILDQLAIDVGPMSTAQDLNQYLGPLGAELLVEGLENESFVPPLKETRHPTVENAEPSYAPAITPEDRHIDWSGWTAGEILVRDRALGELWDMTTWNHCRRDIDGPDTSKRVVFGGPWEVLRGGLPVEQEGGRPRLPGSPIPLRKMSAPREVLPGERREPEFLGICTCDGNIVIPTGGVKADGSALLLKNGKLLNPLVKPKKYEVGF
jgi:methionyl-tRNA formyltransferase